MPFVFTRASEGGPDPMYPPLDERGHRHPTFGPILPMSFIQPEARVRILSRLPGTHRIGLTASNSAFQIDPQEVDIARHVDVRIRGALIPDSEFTLEVRAGGLQGPVVAKLTVRRPGSLLPLPLSLHVVQFFNASGPSGQGPIPDARNLQAAFEGAARFWEPFGIWIGVPRVENAQVVRVRSSEKDRLRLGPLLFTTLNRILDSAHGRGSLDVFLVADMRGMNDRVVRGLGTHPGWVQTRVVSRHGLFVRSNPDAGMLAATIAHEIGHILGLKHVRNMERPRADGTTFALQQLMHNYGPPAAPDDWPPGGVAGTTTRPRFHDVGWGPARSGGVITLKTVPHVTADDQATTAIDNLRGYVF